MADIKTWQQRCQEDPAHDGIVTRSMIQAKMCAEIDDLRAALATEPSREPTQEQVEAWRLDVGFCAYGEDAGEFRIPEMAFHSRLERFAARAYAAGLKAGSGT